MKTSRSITGSSVGIFIVVALRNGEAVRQHYHSHSHLPAVWTCFIFLAYRQPSWLNSTHDTSTTMIKVCTEMDSFLPILTPFLDLEHEEEWGCSGKEEAKDERRSDPRAKRLRFMAFTWYWVLNTLLPSADLTELDLPSTMKTHFPDPADLLNFTLTITPDEGTSPFLQGISYRRTDLLWRHVQEWRFHFLVCYQHKLPTRPSKGQVHTKSKRIILRRIPRHSRIFSSDLPSKCWPWGQRLSEHP